MDRAQKVDRAQMDRAQKIMQEGPHVSICRFCSLANLRQFDGLIFRNNFLVSL